jgi:hypothetical protein
MAKQNGFTKFCLIYSSCQAPCTTGWERLQPDATIWSVSASNEQGCDRGDALCGMFALNLAPSYKHQLGEEVLWQAITR